MIFTQCSRCILDTTILDIRFDADGVCHFCRIHDELERAFPLSEEGGRRLNRLVEKIKKAGRGKPYDIIVGVSGGRDSTYALFQTVRLGLRPLAVHLDNGWNSDIAVTNIKNATTKLNVDLYTYVLNWPEFRDLQKSFLKASVSDAEIPTDVAIHGILHRVAAQEGVRYVVFAHSFRTEGVAPLSWTYMDGRYINSVHQRFGRQALKTFPNMTLRDVLYYQIIKGIRVVPLLAYLPYNQKEIDRLLTDLLDWQYYGGHHHESYFTHFFQSYYLPRKFKIDKRKLEYSALIRSGQMKREEALEEISRREYPYDPALIPYVKSKLELSDEEFDVMMAAPTKTFHDYPTYYPLLRKLRWPLSVAARANIIPRHLYLKFLG